MRPLHMYVHIFENVAFLPSVHTKTVFCVTQVSLFSLGPEKKKKTKKTRNSSISSSGRTSMDFWPCWCFPYIETPLLRNTFRPVCGVVSLRRERFQIVFAVSRVFFEKRRSYGWESCIDYETGFALVFLLETCVSQSG